MIANITERINISTKLTAFISKSSITALSTCGIRYNTATLITVLLIQKVSNDIGNQTILMTFLTIVYANQATNHIVKNISIFSILFAGYKT